VHDCTHKKREKPPRRQDAKRELVAKSFSLLASWRLGGFFSSGGLARGAFAM